MEQPDPSVCNGWRVPDDVGGFAYPFDVAVDTLS